MSKVTQDSPSYSELDAKGDSPSAGLEAKGDSNGNGNSLEVDIERQVPEEKVKKTKFEKFLSLFTTPEQGEDVQVPELSYWEIFRIFLWFGCRAFGGPAAQIAMMKTELVDEAKWISKERFNRVYAVYQVLPGPEATELACYFGYLAGGRFGSFLGGMGFVIPGVSGMLLWSYIYVTYGLTNRNVQASFRAVQNVVAAMIFRATFKLAESALLEKPKNLFNWNKGFLCLFCFLCTTMNLNFFISLCMSGIINAIFEEKRIPYRDLLGYFIAACTIGFYVLYIALHGFPTGSMIGSDSSVGVSRSLASLFELGLIAGCVTFGGAYTTLPFIYSAAVTAGGWLSQRAFLDAVAITNMMPTPLVSFVSVIGFIGGGIEGSILMLIGIFLPAFSFTIIGHHFFEFVVSLEYVHPFLDGVSAAVIGLLGVTCFQFVKSVVGVDSQDISGQKYGGIDAVLFILAFLTLFYFTDKFTQPIGIIVAAIAGQILYQ